MTPEEEQAIDRMIKMISSLANLTQQQANLIAELNRKNLELVSQLEAVCAISKAKL